MSESHVSAVRFFLLPLLALCLGTFRPRRRGRRPVITVTKNAGQIGLALNPLSGPDGAAATKILTDDLNMAGAFALSVGAGSATYTARGRRAAAACRARSWTAAATRSSTKRTPARRARPRTQFADDIVLALTKQHGIAGGKIAFIGTRTGHKEVYICDTDGGNLRQLTNDGNISVGPALSPDGRRLAYTGYKSGYADVYVINLASGARDRVVKFPGTNTGAAFSPDGSRLALSCSKDGNPELYTVGAGGGGARRLTHTPGVESSPTWSPDGGEIIYVSDAGGAAAALPDQRGRRQRAAPFGGLRLLHGAELVAGRQTRGVQRARGRRVRRGGDGPGRRRRDVVASDAGRPAWGADSRHLLFSERRFAHHSRRAHRQAHARRRRRGQGVRSRPGAVNLPLPSAFRPPTTNSPHENPTSPPFAALLMAALPACKSKKNGAYGENGAAARTPATATASTARRFPGATRARRSWTRTWPRAGSGPCISRSTVSASRAATWAVVRQVADFMQTGSNKVIVAGFCDERGTADYNRALGEKRAGAVREALISDGVDPSRLQTVSFGAEMPVDPASNESAWAKNRRGGVRGHAVVNHFSAHGTVVSSEYASSALRLP